MASEDSNSNKTTEAPPAPPKMFSPIGPGFHAGAWNDPPMFSTEFNVAARPSAPNRLNKRVAHPISSGPSPYAGPQVLAPNQGTMPTMGGIPPPTNFNNTSSMAPPEGYQQHQPVNVPPQFTTIMHPGGN